MFNAKTLKTMARTCLTSTLGRGCEIKHPGRAGKWGVLAGVVVAMVGLGADAGVVTTRTDTGLGGAVVDGVLSPNEYGPGNSYSYSGGGTGFGGVIGGPTARLYMNSDATNLYIGFQPGAAVNDVVVIYFKGAGGFIDATMDDQTSGDRAAISNLTANVDDAFPGGFTAKYALTIWPTNPGAFLYQLNGTGLQHTFLSNAGITPANAGAGTQFREMSIPLSTLGVTAGSAIEFFAAYCSSTSFNSNESIPAYAPLNGAVNPGVAGPSAGYGDSDVFVTAGGGGDVVISQIYGAGNNSGATWRNDYIELFNKGSAPVNLSTWSVQYASDISTAWSKTNLTGTIQPGQYYLVAETGGTTNGVPLPAPDATGTIIMSASAGKVALVCNQTALSGACFARPSNGIVDFVGYGTTANCFEGAGPAPAPGATTAVFRASGGCGDTDDNTVDFGTPASAAPRNSASPANPCAGSSANGACCLAAGTCSILTQTACLNNAGAVYQGDYTTCLANTYVVTNTSGAIVDDISASGTPVVVTSGSLDDGFQAGVALGISPAFNFTYFGSSFSTVAIGTNGNVQFTASPASTTTGTIPSTLTPNGTIAAYWRDLVPTAGQIRFQTLGSSPARRFIVQWTGVVNYSPGAGAVPNTFQIILYEGTNVVEFRYGSVTPSTVQTFTVGIESGNGTIGYNIAPSLIGSGGAGAARQFTPVGCAPTGSCCVSGVCSITTQDYCVCYGGAYNGNGTACSPDPCEVRACCLPNATCLTAQTSVQCAGANGLWQGAGSTCPPMPSCPALGPCCVTGACTITFQASCAGTWTAGGSGSCTPNPCVGACCNGPTCTLTDLAGCAYVFQSLGTTCSPVSFCVGRCCFPDGSCTLATSSNCTTAGGAPGAGGTACGGSSYTGATPGTNSIENISIDPAATQLTLGDDASGAAITLPFTFTYFGNQRTSLLVNSNGWLSFDTTGTQPTTAQMRTPVVPVGGATSTNPPNDAVFAYWRDLNQTGAARITYKTNGAAPYRRFIVQWSAIPRFGNTDSNNCEIILYESSNCIELRWGTFTAALANSDFGAGLENATGTAGSDVPATAITPNSSRLFCPAGLACPQPTGACCNGLACTGVSYASCQASGFVFQGTNVTCGSTPCVPTGACCDLTGACLVLTQPACIATGGSSYTTDGSTCASNPCLTGACCTASGACNARTSFGCSFQGGYYTADGTLCTAGPCPTGACCAAGGGCSLVLNAGAGTLCSGAYLGLNSTCGAITYGAPSAPANTLDDISVTGSALTFAGGPDDGDATVALPFAFSFYGVSKTGAQVGTNGFVTFTGPATSPSNVAIPSTGTPNDAIYPLWDDLHLRTNGSVLTQTKGSAPHRTFIIQWNRVARYADSIPYPENTFQVILYETANAVEFRYGAIASTGWSATVGIENADGTAATSVPEASVEVGNTARVFIPSGMTCPQPTGGCCTSAGCTAGSYATCISLGGAYQGDGSSCPATPGSPAANPSTICPGGASSTLSVALVTGETVDWFTGSCGGTPVPGGANPTVSPLATTTYYARARNTTTGCVSGSCASVTVNVSDTTPPTITCPIGGSVQCLGDVPAGASTLAGFVALGGTYSDNCPNGTPTVSYADGPLVGGPCGGGVTRTYSVTDGNGNTSTCAQVFTVHDTVAPSISCPSAIGVMCAAAVPVPAGDLAAFVALGGSASDNCGTVTVSWLSDTALTGGCGGSITRTYRATDACGNFTNCTQTITVNDTTPPSISCPAAVSVQCIADVPAHATDLASFVSAGGTASDNCGSVTVAWISDSTPANACGGTINRTYRATDACGNTANCTQVITIHDTMPPVISVCASAQVVLADGTCHGAIPDLRGLITASDNCTPVSGLVVSQTPSAGAIAGQGITHVVITVADACGNPATCMADVDVQVTTPPAIAYADAGYASLPNGTQVAWPWPGAVGGPLTIGCTAFATVQGAINAVAPGGQVRVAAGAYLENLVVAKSLTLSGSNAGTCAADGSIRAAETVLRPGAASSAVDGILLYVTASNVTIDGFTLDGDNLLPGGEVVNTGHADVSNIIANGSFYNPVGGPQPFVNIRNLRAVNNIIRHANDVAVNLYADGSGIVSDSNDVECNRFSEQQGTNTLNAGGPYSRICVLLYNDTYAAVDHNLFDLFSIGVQTGNNHRAKPAGAASISSNTFTHFNNLAIWHNLHYAGASDWTIGSNSISADPSVVVSSAWGIYVSSIQTAVNVVCTGNNVSRCDTGIRYWNTPTSAALTVAGGTLQLNNTGFVLTNVDPTYGAGDPSTVTVSAVTSINNGVHGFTVSDEPLGLSHVQHLIVEGCTATGHPVGGGINMNGTASRLTVRNAPSTLSNNAYGIYATKGGRVLVEDADLRSNAFAGIQIGLGTMVDAGDCTGSNFSGLGSGHGPLGSSHGGNNLSGYVYDNFSPWAIANLNAPNSAVTVAYAQNNNFGAGPTNNINNVIFDHLDAPLYAAVFASQSGGQGINVQPIAQAVCPGSTVTFTVGALGPVTYQWQRNGVDIGGETGPSLTILGVGPANVANYSVVVTDVCGNVSPSTPAALALLPTPAAPAIAAADTSGYCANAVPATITLTATGGSGTTLEWFSGICGGTAVGTGSPLTIAAPGVTTTYHARWTTVCASSTCADVTVNVSPSPVQPTGITASASSYCSDSAPATITLTASGGSGATLEWFSGSCGGAVLSNANPYTFTAPGSTTTYYARWTNACASSACASIAVMVQGAPTANAGGPYNIVGPTPVAVSGTASNYVATTLWTTSGTGTFTNPAVLSTTYNPTIADQLAGSITLTLTANPISPCATAATSSATLTITPCNTGSVVYVDDGYVGLPFNTAVNFPANGSPGPHLIGCDAFATIQGGINAVVAPGTVNVAAGTYDEDVNANKTVSILGSGAASVVRGVIGGDNATFRVSADNVVIAGFTITRLGNTVADWGNPGLNSAGIATIGATTGALIRDNIITGNRTGIDINNSSGHVIRNNRIVDNRTGLLFRNATDNLVVAENDIANNWTVGVLFLDGSGGTNSPVQSATGTTFHNNNISGNWYGQIVDRQLGGSLPAPGTSNLKNFSGNWYGTASPVISSTDSAEPGYGAQIPVVFGGTAVPPGGQPDILGPASANFDVTPWLNTGVDTNNGAYPPDTFAFQGDFSNLTVSSRLAQSGASGRIQEGHDLATTGGTVIVSAGTFAENVSITKRLTIGGAGAGDCDSPANPATQTVVTAAAPSTPVFDIVDVGGLSVVQRLTLRDMRITGANGTADGLSSGVRVSAASGQTRQFYRFENLTVTGNSGHGIALGSVGTINDVEVATSHLCANYRAIVVDNTLAGFSALSISGSTIKNNVFHGLSINGTPNGSFVPTNISVSSSVFSNNGQSNNLFQGSGDLSFFLFNGNASLTNVTVHTTGRFPVQFRGRGTDNFSTPWAPAGVITINGLTVDGASDRAAIYMHYYSNVDGVSLNNVDLSGVTSSAAPFSGFAVAGMTLAHLGATPLPLGNTIFPCQGGQAAGYVGLALFAPGGAAADCTTVFVGASTLAQKENCVFDVAELASVGDVTFLDAAVTGGPSSTSACLGTPASFTVTAVGSGLSYQWYHNNLGTPVGLNSPTYSIPSVGPTDAGTYFVVVTGVCGPVTSPSATLAITPGPAAASGASVDTPSICTGSGPTTITLTAVGGSGDTFTWYAGGCGSGGSIGTGLSITIPAPPVTTTYYGRWSNGCGSSACVSATVTHVPPPTANAGGPYTICADGVASLTGSSPNAAGVQWTTLGDGSFNNNAIVNAVYTPGPGDISAGSTTLMLTANPVAPCSVAATSSATLTINPVAVAPASVSSDANNFCAGSIANITLSAVGGFGSKLHWTADACVGPSLGNGVSITIGAPAVTTTYYAHWVNSCGSSSCASFTVTVYPNPVLPSVGSDSAICSGQPFTLTGSAGAGEVIDWFEGSCGGTSVGTGFSIVVTPATTTTYHARARNTTTGCISGCKLLVVTVNPTPTSPTGAGVDSASYCSDAVPSNITLSASGGTGGDYAWYTTSCGGTPIGSGSPLTIAAPTSTTTYFVRRETGTCVSNSCASVTVTINPTPTSPSGASVDAPAFCSGSAPTNIVLSASGGTGGTYHWYSGSCGSGPVGAGSPLTIGAPTATTTYYVRRETATCNSASCVSVTVTVNATPVAPTGASVDNASFCEGAVPSITLAAAGGSGTTLKWYSGSCGGTLVGAGSPLTIGAPTVSTTYFARWETPLCGNSSCASADVHVDPSAHAPTGINTSANNYCAGSVTTLTLTAVGGSGATLEWFEATCAGTPIGTGNPLVIPAPVTSKTYFARWNIPICGPSTCASIAITVNPVTGGCCVGWGTQKLCNVVDPINCIGVTTPILAYRGNCTVCGAPFCCGADYNNNGTLEIQDIFDFLADWFLQVQTSDFNHDGFKNVQDIFDFLAAWFAGCH